MKFLETFKATRITNGDYTYRGYRITHMAQGFTGLWDISVLTTEITDSESVTDDDFKREFVDSAGSFTAAKDLIDRGLGIKGRLLTLQEHRDITISRLYQSVTVDGETRNKEKFGFASNNADHRTFTGNTLWTLQLRTNEQGNTIHNSVEQKWEDTHMVDGIVYWKNNGQIPPMEFLLDFVQICKIKFTTAEKCILQRHQEKSESLKHLMVNSKGQVCLHADAFKTYESRSI